MRHGSIWGKIATAMSGRALTENAHSFITKSLALDGAASMPHDLILQKSHFLKNPLRPRAGSRISFYTSLPGKEPLADGLIHVYVSYPVRLGRVCGDSAFRCVLHRVVFSFICSIQCCSDTMPALTLLKVDDKIR